MHIQLHLRFIMVTLYISSLHTLITMNVQRFGRVLGPGFYCVGAKHANVKDRLIRALCPQGLTSKTVSLQAQKYSKFKVAWRSPRGQHPVSCAESFSGVALSSSTKAVCEKQKTGQKQLFGWLCRLSVLQRKSTCKCKSL